MGNQFQRHAHAKSFIDKFKSRWHALAWPWPELHPACPNLKTRHHGALHFTLHFVAHCVHAHNTSKTSRGGGGVGGARAHATSQTNEAFALLSAWCAEGAYWSGAEARPSVWLSKTPLRFRRNRVHTWPASTHTNTNCLSDWLFCLLKLSNCQNTAPLRLTAVLFFIPSSTQGSKKLNVQDSGGGAALEDVAYFSDRAVCGVWQVNWE